ncbi:MAG: hypothetical protein II725_00575 [Firmicutes bacterium]|nr:hypothetical protein [Bacillota bacterium]
MKVKKLIVIAVSLLFIISALGVEYIFASDNAYSINNEDLAISRSKLESYGWTEEEIDTLFTDEMILQYRNTDRIENTEVKYYRVSEKTVEELTESECLRQVEEIKLAESKINNRTSPIPIGDDISTQVTTSDGYLKYTLTIAHDINGRYLITANFDWLLIPITRGKDVFGITSNTFLTISNAHYFTYSAIYNYNNGTTWKYVTHTPSGGWCHSSHGEAVIFALVPDDSNNYIATNHRGVLMAWADPDTGSSGSTAKVTADYFHRELSLTGSVSVSFSGGSISVTPAWVYNHMLSNPSLQFTI